MTVHVSPTQIALYDACPRKWAYRYIEGLKEPETEQQVEGIEGHARVEALLKHGQEPGNDKLGKLINAARRPGYLPLPDSSLLLEQEFFLPLEEGSEFVGFIDCLVPPENGVAVVIDHKFVSNLTWAKTPIELAGDPQAIAYGRAAVEFFPEAERVECRWLYYQKGSKKVLPVSFTTTAREARYAWEGLKLKASVLANLRVAAPHPEAVRGNESACVSYGGCPYRSKCSIGSALGSFPKNFFTSSEGFSTSSFPRSTAQGVKDTMGLLDQLNAMRSKAAPAQAAPAQPAPAQATPSLQDIMKSKGAKGVNPPQAVPAETVSNVLEAMRTPTTVVAATAKPLGLLDSLKAKQTAAQTPAQAPAPAQAAPVHATPAALAPAVVMTAKAQPSTANGQLSVILQAAVLKYPNGKERPVQLVELLEPLMQQVADGAGKAHWLMIPYNEGKAGLAYAFDRWLTESAWKGTILVDPFTEEAKAVREVLYKHADVLVRGLA
jgi:hypothetical protein